MSFIIFINHGPPSQSCKIIERSRPLIKQSPLKTAAEEFEWKCRKNQVFLFSLNGGQLRRWCEGRWGGCRNGAGKRGAGGESTWGRKSSSQRDPAGWRAGGRGGWVGSGWTLCWLGREKGLNLQCGESLNRPPVVLNLLHLLVPTYAGTEIDHFLRERSGILDSEKVRLE